MRAMPMLGLALGIGLAIPAYCEARPTFAPSAASGRAGFELVADAQRGASIFQNRCSACHTVAAGAPNKFGPNLHGLFGRKAGSLPGYNYSPAMRASGIVWDPQTLDRYLTNPHRDVPGDKMPFPGLPSKADRDDVITYLAQATK